MQKVCGGAVSNDFLRLLMLGMPSDELQQFLLHDLTEKVMAGPHVLPSG